ncbi:hypothetical protein FQN55_009452 [Onygenales sp. PD_40]|nr:hypothetical protein FQN55_009452 [Onygenales sp. PD_40]
MEPGPGEPIPDISGRLMYPSIIFTVVTPISVGLRIASRLHFTRRLGRDDWTIILSCIFSIILSAMMIVVCEWSFGKHTHDVDPVLIMKSLKLFVAAQVIYKVTIALSKISMLFLYLRIFVDKRFRQVCWAIVYIVLAYTVGSSVATIFQCTPIRRAWNRNVPGTCINLAISWYSNAAFSISSDLAILILPMPVIKSLRLPQRAKIGLMTIFALGIFVCITSVLRALTLDLAATNPDIIWSATNSSMWTVTETNIAIICACMPTYKAPLAKILPRAFGPFYSSASGNKSKDHTSEDVGTTDRRASSIVSRVPLYRLSLPRFSGWELVAEKLEFWAKRLGDGCSNSGGGDEGMRDAQTVSDASTLAGDRFVSKCVGQGGDKGTEGVVDLESGKESVVMIPDENENT